MFDSVEFVELINLKGCVFVLTFDESDEPGELNERAEVAV